MNPFSMIFIFGYLLKKIDENLDKIVNNNWKMVEKYSKTLVLKIVKYIENIGL